MTNPKQKNEKYNIVMFSMSAYFEWQPSWHGGVINRNYFILQQLLKDERVNKILHIDYVAPGFRYFFKELLKARPYKKNPETVYKSSLTKVNKVTDKFYVCSSLNNINKIKKIINFLNLNKNLIIWSYDPFKFKIFSDKYPGKYKVFDTVDNQMEHPNYKNKINKLKKGYEYIKNNADYIFTVSNDLRRIFDKQDNVTWLPNGVNNNHWQNKTDSQLKDLKNIPKPIIGYHGIIQERFDQELISYLANNNPDKSFIFVGWKWKRVDFSLLDNYKNIYFLGHKNFDELPKYVNNFDVAIIPHKIDEFTKSMNPLKIYEYLATGKPIVSTQIAGLEPFEELVYISKNYEEFNNNINQAIKDDNKDIISKRISTAKKHDWKNRIDKIFNIISKK